VRLAKTRRQAEKEGDVKSLKILLKLAGQKQNRLHLSSESESFVRLLKMEQVARQKHFWAFQEVLS